MEDIRETYFVSWIEFTDGKVRVGNNMLKTAKTGEDLIMRCVEYIESTVSDKATVMSINKV